MSYADVLLTADDVVATLEREGTGIFSVDVHDRTINGVYAHVALLIKGIRDHPASSMGVLLDLAARVGLEGVEMQRGRRAVRGTLGQHVVELAG